MHVEFWGAARTVTGSMHLVHYRGKQILLDCGLFQGKRKEAFRRNRDFPLDASKIDAVVLSHAHIDHSGNLPTLINAGYKGPIYATSATCDLAVHLLLDSAKIQKYDVKYVNKKRKQAGQSLFEPLYHQHDAMQTIRQMKRVDYFKDFEILPGVTCNLSDAGHMLGSAIVGLTFDKEEGSGRTKLVFSGDIGRPDMPILRDPQIVEGADYIIMESLYGNRNHREGSDTVGILKKAIDETIAENGKLIIPAFSVGRTQQIIYALNHLYESDQLEDDLQVFVDSPLAVDATTVFRSHHECFDEEMMDRLLEEDDNDPLGFPGLHYIRAVKHSKLINKYRKPAVIISASGMCESGRILHHLKNNIEKESTTIMFSGYQAPHTLGRRIADGSKTVHIYGQEFQVNAKIAKLEGTSGHADQTELLDWAQKVSRAGNVKGVALVHCEMGPAKTFAETLERNKIGPVMIPDRGDKMELL